MARSSFVKRLLRVFDTLSSGSGRETRRSRSRRFAGLETLEGRTLLSTINASGVISSAASGADTIYTIDLSNASSSDSGIGTFWYAWVPGEDLLATNPISVSAPAGWTETVTNTGATDGFGIEFIANSAAYDVQPGSSLTFSFTSADSPTSVAGNSPFYPGMSTSTSTVFPQGPFSDSGHQFVVTPAPTPTPTPAPAPTPTPAPAPAPTPAPTAPPITTPTPTPTAPPITTPTPTPTAPPTTGTVPTTPPVTVTGIREVRGRRSVTEIIVSLSDPVNAAQADSPGSYRLVAANGRGSFTSGNSPVMKLRSAVFDPANDTVILTPRMPFAFNRAVELTIFGRPDSGIDDTFGRPIDGDNNGAPGSNALAFIRGGAVTMETTAPPADVPIIIITPPAPTSPTITTPISTPTPLPQSPPTPTPIGTPKSTPTPISTPTPTPDPDPYSNSHADSHTDPDSHADPDAVTHADPDPDSHPTDLLNRST